MASAGDALRDCSGDQRRRPRWLRLWESGRTSQNKEQPLPGWKRSPLWSGAEIESCRRKEYCRRKQLVGIDVDNVDGFKERQRAAAGTQSQPERARDEGGSQRKSKPARQVLLHNGRGLLCSCLRLGNDSAQEPIHQRGPVKRNGALPVFKLLPSGTHAILAPFLQACRMWVYPLQIARDTMASACRTSAFTWTRIECCRVDIVLPCRYFYCPPGRHPTHAICRRRLRRRPRRQGCIGLQG
jgi:hypothetical protein